MTTEPNAEQADPAKIRGVSAELAGKYKEMTHTSRLLQQTLAADKMNRETGIPRRAARTIMGACIDRLTEEERERLAREVTGLDFTPEDDRDQS
jgi:hypothetical protein